MQLQFGWETERYNSHLAHVEKKLTLQTRCARACRLRTFNICLPVAESPFHDTMILDDGRRTNLAALCGIWHLVQGSSSCHPVLCSAWVGGGIEANEHLNIEHLSLGTVVQRHIGDCTLETERSDKVQQVYFIQNHGPTFIKGADIFVQGTLSTIHLTNPRLWPVLCRHPHRLPKHFPSGDETETMRTGDKVDREKMHPCEKHCTSEPNQDNHTVKYFVDTEWHVVRSRLIAWISRRMMQHRRASAFLSQKRRTCLIYHCLCDKISYGQKLSPLGAVALVDVPLLSQARSKRVAIFHQQGDEFCVMFCIFESDVK